MAPATLEQVDEQLKAIVQNLYSLSVQAYEHQGTATEEAMKREIQALVGNLVSLARAAPSIQLEIPRDVLEYIQNARNPDIYTRDFLELVQRKNQNQKGRSEAFAQFRDILAKEIMSAMPDVRQEVKRVVEATGGKING